MMISQKKWLTIAPVLVPMLLVDEILHIVFKRTTTLPSKTQGRRNEHDSQSVCPKTYSLAGIQAWLGQSRYEKVISILRGL